MSGESPYPGPERKLRQEEKVLVSALLKHAGINSYVERLRNTRVVDMSDGGMGSIRFVGTRVPDRKLARKLAEAEYLDEDGVLVSFVLNADETGDLLELDAWKVDFSPLRRYPRPMDLTFR